MLHLNKYWRSRTYQRYRMSMVFAILIGVMFCVIEAIWLGLGNWLDVDVLVTMGTYAAIPFSILLVVMIISTIVHRKKFKQMVADGSIEKEMEQATALQASYLRSFLPAMNASPAPVLDPVEQKIVGLAKLHPRLDLAGLARRVGVPRDAIEDMLLKLASSGALKGHIDPGTGDFISGMVDTSRVTPIDDNIYDCPHCGSPMKSAPVRGTTARCESCGQLIVVK